MFSLQTRSSTNKHRVDKEPIDKMKQTKLPWWWSCRFGDFNQREYCHSNIVKLLNWLELNQILIKTQEFDKLLSLEYLSEIHHLSIENKNLPHFSNICQGQ